MFGIFGGAQELTGATSDAGTHGRLDTANSILGTLDTDLNAGLGTDGAGESPANGSGVRGWLRSIYDKLNSGVSVSGTVAVSNFPATQPVSAASLPLPAGAAQDATLTSGTQKTQVTNFPATQPVSGTVTANAGTGTFATSDSTSQTKLDTLHTDNGAQGTGLTPPTGGSGIIGFLSGIYNRFTDGTQKAQMYDGTNVLGTSSHPVRTDPVGTTTQPVLAKTHTGAHTYTGGFSVGANVQLASAGDFIHNLALSINGAQTTVQMWEGASFATATLIMVFVMPANSSISLDMDYLVPTGVNVYLKNGGGAGAGDIFATAWKWTN